MIQAENILIQIQKRLASYRWIVPLLLRIPTGLVFIRFGFEKFEIPKAMVDMVMDSPFSWTLIIDPVMTVKVVGIFEIITGILLVFGLLTRLAAIVGIGLLIPIIVIADVRQDFVLLAVLVSLALSGAGPWSLDAAWDRKKKA